MRRYDTAQSGSFGRRPSGIDFAESVSVVDGADMSSRPSTATSRQTSYERHRVSMQFVDRNTEDEYARFFTRKYTRRLRKIFVIITLTVLCFGIPGVFLKWSDDAFELTLVAVCTIFLPGLILFGLTFTSFFKDSFVRHQHSMLFFALSLSVSPIVTAVMVNDAQDEHVLSSILLMFGAFPILTKMDFKRTATLMGLVTFTYTTAVLVAGVPETIWQATGFLGPILLGVAVFGLMARIIEGNNREFFINSRLLEKDNRKLKHELRRLQKTRARTTAASIDLETGAEKIIALLTELGDSVGDREAELIQHVIKLLRSEGGNIFAPNITSQLQGGSSLDQETQNWLFSELAAQQRTNNRKVSFRGQRTPGRSSQKTPVSIMPLLLPQEDQRLSELFSTADMWNIDIFQCAALTNEQPLFYVANYLFNKHDLMQKFRIDSRRFNQFAAKIEAGYPKNNPFHNRIHAADVMMNINYLLTSPDMVDVFTDVEIFAALYAAMVHDYEHPGQNNAFQVSAENANAILYNDRSVLENHHISAASFLTRQDDYNIFSEMSRDDRKEVRDLAIEMVLATDMAQHFGIMGQFKSKLSAAGENEGLNLEKRADRLLLLKVLIKCSDIGHTTKMPKLHLEWTNRIQTEFYDQGDEEKRLQLPVSAFMDREKSSVAKSQVGFLDFVVSPMFEAVADKLPSFAPKVTQLRDNHDEWKRKADLEVAAGTS